MGEPPDENEGQSAPIGLIAAAITGEQPWTWDRRYHPSLRDHMHALGVVAAHYNHLEQVFQLLFWRYSALDSTPALRLFQRLNNNRNRIDSLIEWIENKEYNAEMKERALHFVSGFEVCAENRNFLMHGLTQSPLSASDSLVLAKAARRDPERHNFLHLRLQDIRQIANEIDNLWILGMRLYVWYRARSTGGTIILNGKKISPTLPEIPPAPVKLIPQNHPSEVGS
jgi:hypothetical protein